MDKVNVVYIYNGIFFSLKKRNPDVVSPGVNLEDIMLSETHQTYKDKCCMISLTCRN